jgi:hypothetical protein
MWEGRSPRTRRCHWGGRWENLGLEVNIVIVEVVVVVVVVRPFRRAFTTAAMPGELGSGEPACLILYTPIYDAGKATINTNRKSRPLYKGKIYNESRVRRLCGSLCISGPRWSPLFLISTLRHRAPLEVDIYIREDGRVTSTTTYPSSAEVSDRSKIRQLASFSQGTPPRAPNPGPPTPTPTRVRVRIAHCFRHPRAARNHPSPIRQLAWNAPTGAPPRRAPCAADAGPNWGLARPRASGRVAQALPPRRTGPTTPQTPTAHSPQPTACTSTTEYGPSSG